MPPSKRQREILQVLEHEGTVALSDLARKLDVSLETIRRDIRPLADSGRLIKMHGAISLLSTIGEAPFEKRMRENREGKKSIAAAVAATIRDGDSIMMDTGTTTSFLARELIGHRRLTVVTNSSDIARTLATLNDNKVYMAGGELRSDNGAAFGSTAIDFVSRFSVTHAIISTGAVNVQGMMDYDFEEAEFARTVLMRGRRKLVVTDHSKFGREGLVRVAGFEAITEIATDMRPPADIVEAIDAAGVCLLLA